MTHDELMALPEMDSRWGERTEVIDGQKVTRPIPPKGMRALFNPTWCYDAGGTRWMVGTDVTGGGQLMRVRCD
jgi:hypothetical protein